MELPWVLLALAGTGAAAGLGDFPRGAWAEGDGGSEGLQSLFLGGLCKVFVSGRGLWGWVWLGGPHTGAVPLVLAPLAPREPPLSLLPYVPRVPPAALPGKLTATTFALERPCCVFDRHANASDAVWLVVAFANASAAFRNPPSRADVPLYEQLPTACSYMTLETAAATYACSAASPAVLRVGGDTVCGGQGGRDPCNGPLPSPGPYRAPRRGLVQGVAGRALRTPLDTSACLSLQRQSGGVPVPPGFGDQHLRPQILQDPPHPPSPAPDPAPRLWVQPPGAGLLCPPTSRSLSCQVNFHFTSATASSLSSHGRRPPAALLSPQLGALFTRPPLPALQGWSCGGWRHQAPQKPPGTLAWWHLVTGGGTCCHRWGLWGAPRWASP
uniref:Uroplakin 3B n=1 Tax=Strix occidentalis caurina TaxID=311401 RepID=A0A8D0EHM2_STROC